MWLGKQLTHKIVYEYYLILHRKIIIGFPGQTILWVWVLLEPSLSIVLPAAFKEEMLLCLSMRRVFSCKRLGLLAQGKTHAGERLVEGCFVSVQWVLLALSHRVEESAAENVQQLPCCCTPPSARQSAPASSGHTTERENQYVKSRTKMPHEKDEHCWV